LAFEERGQEGTAFRVLKILAEENHLHKMLKEVLTNAVTWIVVVLTSKRVNKIQKIQPKKKKEKN